MVLALTASGLSTVRRVSFLVTELPTAEELFPVLVLVWAVVPFVLLLLMRSSLLMLTPKLARLLVPSSPTRICRQPYSLRTS